LATLSPVTYATMAKADPIPLGAVGQNIESVGYSNLNDKPGFKMSIQKVGECWYLYLGMLWNEGWQIVDVTEPAEAIAEDCKEPLQLASIVDIADPAKPQLMAMFPLPLPPADWPMKSFCERGGRFGPHNQNTLLHNPFVQPQGNLVYLTYSTRACGSTTSARRPRHERSAISSRPIRPTAIASFQRASSSRRPRTSWSTAALYLHHRQEPGAVCA
jgi:hypothetical protein